MVMNRWRIAVMKHRRNRRISHFLRIMINKLNFFTRSEFGRKLNRNFYYFELARRMVSLFKYA